MTESTERIRRDELNRLVVMTLPTGAMEPLPRRHRRADSVIAATLPAVAPVRAPRMRAPTLVGSVSTIVEPPPAPPLVVAPIVVEAPAPPPQIVAMAPAIVAASVRPYRFALAALLYALVLFALLAGF